MKIGILGTGGVGQTLSAKLVEGGHEVMLGTRDVAATRPLKCGTNRTAASRSAPLPKLLPMARC